MPFDILSVITIVLIFGRLLFMRNAKVNKKLEKSYYSIMITWYIASIIIATISIAVLFYSPLLSIIVVIVSIAIIISIEYNTKNRLLKSNLNKAEKLFQQKRYKESLKYLSEVYEQHPSENIKSDLTKLEYLAGVFLYGKWLFSGRFKDDGIQLNSHNNLKRIMVFKREDLTIILINKDGRERYLHLKYKLEDNRIYIMYNKNIISANYFMEVRALRFTNNFGITDLYRRIP